MLLTTTFKSNQINQTFNIYQRDHSFSTYAKFTYVCVSEGKKCYFFGKFRPRTKWMILKSTLKTVNQENNKWETPLDIRLNNKHKKDIKYRNVILACKHFKKYILTLTITRKKTKKYNYRNSRDINTKTKTTRKLLDNETWNFSATCYESLTKLNSYHAAFPFITSNHFCVWLK